MNPLVLSTLLQIGASLLPSILGDGGAEERENAREDQYNANQGQAMNNFMADYIMQPIGPAPGMPTLNDPSAFEAYDPNDPMAYGDPGMDYEQAARMGGITPGMIGGVAEDFYPTPFGVDFGDVPAGDIFAPPPGNPMEGRWTAPMQPEAADPTGGMGAAFGIAPGVMDVQTLIDLFGTGQQGQGNTQSIMALLGGARL